MNVLTYICIKGKEETFSGSRTDKPSSFSFPKQQQVFFCKMGLLKLMKTSLNVNSGGGFQVLQAPTNLCFQS